MTLTLVLSEDERLLSTLRGLRRAEFYTLNDMIAQGTSRPELERPDLVLVKGATPADSVHSVSSIAAELPSSALVVVDVLTDDLKQALWAIGDYGILPPDSSNEVFQQLIDHFDRSKTAGAGGHEVAPPAPAPSQAPSVTNTGGSIQVSPITPGAPTGNGNRNVLSGHGVQVDMVGADKIKRVLMSGSDAVSLDPVDHTRVIAIVSPKGGVGKTSIATNLAFSLASRHQNKVVLVDLDLQSPAVSTQLNIYPQATIEHAVSPEAQIDTLMLKTLLVKHEKGFYVLPGAISPASRDLITGDQIRVLIRQLKTEFEYVILDTAGGITDITLSVLDECSGVLLVSTLDLASVKSLKREIEVIKQIGLLPQHKIFCVNQAVRNSGLRVKDIEELMGFPVDVLIQREADVLTSINRGEPMLGGKKKNGFTKGIALISSLVEKVTAEDQGKPKHRRLEV